jgi:hypothetical protein
VRAVTDPCAPCDRVNACALVAAPPRRCSAATKGSRRRPKSPQARRAPPFAAGQLCHATGARLVPWRQPGGWEMKSLTASTAPFRPEPDASRFLLLFNMDPDIIFAASSPISSINSSPRRRNHYERLCFANRSPGSFPCARGSSAGKSLNRTGFVGADALPEMAGGDAAHELAGGDCGRRCRAYDRRRVMMLRTRWLAATLRMRWRVVMLRMRWRAFGNAAHERLVVVMLRTRCCT